MNRFAIFLAAGVSALALGSAAQAADLIIEEPIVGVVETTGDWEGPFVGVFGGYGWGNTEIPIDAFSMDLAGWLVGVDVGANFYISDGIVVGIVGDIAWSDITGTDSTFYALPYTFGTDWVGSLRGRLGFDGGAFMPYLTGGLAVAGATAEYGGLTTSSNTHFGWTVGAGVEIAATEDLSIDLLYRYSDYGTQTYDVGGGPYDETLTTHQVTAGLHWNF